MAKKLTPAQKRRQTLDRTLYNPTKPLGGAQLRHAVNALVDSQVKPQIASLDRQRDQTKRQASQVTGDLKSFYDQLGAQQRAIVDSAAKTSASGNSALQQIGANTQASLTGSQDAARARMAEDASVRGDIATTGGVAQQLADRYAANAAREGTLAGADASRGAKLNTAGEQLIQGLAGASNMRGQEQGHDVANTFAKTLREITEKKSDVQDKRAGMIADVGTKMRQNEFNNLMTMGGLDLKQQDLQTTLAATNAKIGETGRHNRSMEKAARGKTKASIYSTNAGLANTQARINAAKGKGKNGGLTPAQKRQASRDNVNFWSKIHDAADGGGVVDSIYNGIKANNKAVRDGSKKDGTIIPVNEATVKAALRKQKYSPLEIEAILALRPSHGGKIPTGLMKQLKDAGYTVPKGIRGVGKPSTPLEHGAHDVGSILGALFG